MPIAEIGAGVRRNLESLVINALEVVRRSGSGVSGRGSRQLQWREHWKTGAGAGCKLGLIDTDYDQRLPDMCGATVTLRPGGFRSSRLHHGTVSVTTLVAQGHDLITGLVPRAHLFVAPEIAEDGATEPRLIVAGMEWLLEQGVRLVALPFGGKMEASDIGNALKAGVDRGVIFFAASGGGWSEELLFPARHAATIAVAASDDVGTPCFHRDAPDNVDLIAPGWNVPSLGSAGVTSATGSSIACVIATAVAALAIANEAIDMSQVNRESVVRLLREAGG
jgi:subtilisin family serine protease